MRLFFCLIGRFYLVREDRRAIINVSSPCHPEPLPLFSSIFVFISPVINAERGLSP